MMTYEQIINAIPSLSLEQKCNLVPILAHEINRDKKADAFASCRLDFNRAVKAMLKTRPDLFPDKETLYSAEKTRPFAYARMMIDYYLCKEKDYGYTLTSEVVGRAYPTIQHAVNTIDFILTHPKCGMSECSTYYTFKHYAEGE